MKWMTRLVHQQNWYIRLCWLALIAVTGWALLPANTGVNAAALASAPAQAVTPSAISPVAQRYYDTGMAQYKQALAGGGVPAATQAIHNFDMAIEITPDFGLAHLARAKTMSTWGFFGADRTAADFDLAVSLLPDNAEAYFERFKFTFKITLNQAGGMDPNKATYFSTFLSQPGAEQALSDLAASLRLNPNYFEALVYQAGFDLAERKPDAALADYGLAVKNMPADTQPTFAYGVYMTHAALLYVNQQWAALIPDCTKALALTKQAEAYYLRGQAYEHTGDVARMIADFRAAIQLDPPYRGRLQTELPKLGELLAGLKPGSSLYTQLQGFIQESKGNSAALHTTNPQALSAYTQGVESVKELNKFTSQDIYWNHLQEVDTAIGYFTTAINADSGFLEAYLARAKAHIMKSAFNWEEDAALQDLVQLITSHPDYAPGYLERGKFMLSQFGKLEDAAIDLDKTLTLEPDNFEALYTRGQVYQQQGKLDQALASFAHAEKVMPKDVSPAHLFEFYAGRGITLVAINRLTEGMADLQKAFGMVPNLNPDRYDELRFRANPLLQQQLAKLDPGTKIYPQLAQLIDQISKANAVDWGPSK